MRLEFKDGVLMLMPESAADAAEIARLFGPRQERGDFCGGAYGYAIQMNAAGNVEVAVADASWNRDD